MSNKGGYVDAIAAGLTRIFEHRESFIVIGLTGRTGSGCTTVADALVTDDYNALGLPMVQNPPRGHEDRKFRIVNNWLKSHWHPFTAIRVSHAIASFALQQTIGDLERFLQKHFPALDIAPLKSSLTSANGALRKISAVIEAPGRAQEAEIREARRFLFETLPLVANQLKDHIVKTTPSGTYTKLFQTLGDNVRSSGSAFSAEPSPDALLALPTRIFRVMEVARLCNRFDGSKRNYFVIDALRHPFEIRFLRERVSRFFLMAVRTDDTSRVARLHETGWNKKEISDLDKKEYPPTNQKFKDYKSFISQDLQGCLQLADVYISNGGTPDKKDLADLKQQVTRYIALMQHPGLVTPTRDERCMQAAFTAKVNSGCISRQVGAVVTDAQYSIKGVGWNDAPRGQVPCLLRNTAHALLGSWDEDAYSDYEKHDEEFRKHLQKTKLGALKVEHQGGRNIAYCFKTEYNAIKRDTNQVHTRSLHAEENAFLQIAKSGGEGLEGGCLFSTHSPCELCAKKAFQIGIKKIYYVDPYPGISADHVLGSGTGRPEVILFFGAVGRAYHDLYEPIMPYKDELQAIVSPPLAGKKPTYFQIVG
jgi:deoxycytidylate deaminase